MALVLEGINLVKERARMEARAPGVTEALRSLWIHFQQLKNPDLKIAFITDTHTADVVISDSACKLYALFLAVPAGAAIDSFFKGSDHATVAGTNADIAVKIIAASAAGKQYCPCWHDGLPLGTGLTVNSHTANNGNTKSANADAAAGFAIVGAP